MSVCDEVSTVFNRLSRLRSRRSLAAALFVLHGCMQIPGQPPVVVECKTPTAPDRPGPALVGQTYGMAMTPLPLNSVQFGSHEVARSMAVQNLFASRTSTDSVQVQVRFVSCLDRPTSVRVRTSFLRNDSSPAEAPSAWQLMFLQPRATALYSELSTSQDAERYLIEVGQ